MRREFLAESEVVYRALIEAAPDGIVIANQEGRIVLVNAQTEKLFGCKREELVNQSVEILVPESARGKHRFHRAGFMSGPVLRPMGASLELYGVRKDGTEFPVEISLSPIQTDSGLLVSSAIRISPPSFVTAAMTPISLSSQNRFHFRLSRARFVPFWTPANAPETGSFFTPNLTKIETATASSQWPHLTVYKVCRVR